MGPGRAGSRPCTRQARRHQSCAERVTACAVRPTASTDDYVRDPADPAAMPEKRESASQISDRLTPWLNTGAEEQGSALFLNSRRRALFAARPSHFFKRWAETPR